MATDYNSLLTTEQKRTLLQERLTQFAAEAYQHDINLQIATRLNDQATIDASTSALDTLTTVIDFHQETLNNLPADTTPGE
jgi:predicted component of type VI protein secretion system